MKTKNYSTRIMKALKTFSLALIVLGFAFTTQAQTRMQGSLYNLNGFSLNSSYAGLESCTQGYLGHKSQWVGVEGAPQNTYLNVNTGLGQNFGLGVNVFRTSSGLLTNTDFSLALAHHLKLNKVLKLSYSFNVGYYLAQFEAGDAVSFDRDYRSQATTNTGGMYADFGLLLSHEKFDFGVALPRIINTDLEFEGDAGSNKFQNQRFLTVHGKYKHNLNDHVQFVPAVVYRSIPSNGGIVDITVGGVYKKTFGVNVGYRTQSGLIASAHYTHKELVTIGYAYDAGMANVAGLSGGSHEVLLGIKVCRKNPKKDKEPKQSKQKEEPMEEPTPAPKVKEEFLAIGVLVDSETNTPLANAQVEFINDSTGEKSNLQSDENGKFSTKIDPNSSYSIDVKALNYKEQRTNWKTQDLNHNEYLAIDMEQKAPRVFATVVEYGSDKPLAGVIVELVNLDNVKDNYTVTTDKDGKFSFELKDKSLNSPLNYELIYSKSSYMKESTKLLGELKTVEPLDLSKAVEKEIKLKSIAPGADLAKLLGLESILFSSGKTDISEASKKELDKVIALLNNNPDLHIMVGAHTDCTGSAALNQRLSNGRAKAAAQYIQSNISNPKRITNKGFGESKPDVSCECNTCTDEQLAQNRRLSFEIVMGK